MSIQSFWAAPTGTLVQQARARVDKVTFIFGASSLYDCLLGTFKRPPKSLLRWLGETPEARLAKLDERLAKYLRTRKAPASSSLMGMMALRFFTHPDTGLDSSIRYITDASYAVEELISDGAETDLEVVDRFTQLWEMLGELDAEPLEESLHRMLRGRGPHPDLEEALQQAHDDHVGCEDFSWLDAMKDTAKPEEDDTPIKAKRAKV